MEQTLKLKIQQDGTVNGVVEGSPADNGQGGGGTGGGDDSGPQPGAVVEFPVGTVTNNGTRFNSAGEVLRQGVYYYFGAVAGKKYSFAIDSGGYPVYVGFNLDNMQRDATGGSNWHAATEDGPFYVMYTADEGRVQGGHVDVLDA